MRRSYLTFILFKWRHCIFNFANRINFPIFLFRQVVSSAIVDKYIFLFRQVVSSAIVDKYIGESARLIREMFGKFQ